MKNIFKGLLVSLVVMAGASEALADISCEIENGRGMVTWNTSSKSALIYTNEWEIAGTLKDETTTSATISIVSPTTKDRYVELIVPKIEGSSGDVSVTYNLKRDDGSSIKSFTEIAHCKSPWNVLY